MLNDPPKFYLFEDGNGWHKTDDTLTRKITMDISLGKVVQTAGRCFYPQWPKPKYKSATRLAWKVNAEGYVVLRWWWKIKEHNKKHQGCKMLNGKQCGVRIPERLRWDEKQDYWVLVSTDGRASEQEAKVLDKKLD